MISRRFKRVAGIVGASALLVAGATTAQAIGPGDINPDVSDGYYGWHQGDTNGQNSFEVRWDGLYFGYNGKAQIINGLVGTGERPDQQLSADQLIDQIANSGLADPQGAVFYQVALYYIPAGEDVAGDVTAWTTLRPASAAAEADGQVALDVTEDWTGSGGVLGALGPAPLADLLSALGAEAYEVAAYGVYAESESSVSQIIFDGEVHTFGFDVNAPYSPSGDATEGGLSDFVVVGDTQAAEICEGIEFGAGGAGELLYSVEPIQIEGETVEAQWAELYSVLASLNGSYLSDEGDDANAFGAVHLSHGVNQEDANQITLQPLGASPTAEVTVTGELEGFENGGDAILGDVVQALVANPDFSVWVDGFSVISADGTVILQDVQFYDNVNLVFPGVCDSDDEETPTTPGDIGSDDKDSDDGDAATPVVKAPAYTG